MDGAEAGRGPEQLMRRFPMFTIPVRELLQLPRLEPHEELSAEGLLVEWVQGMGTAVFVSHTWLRRTHPDPSGLKLSLLKQFFCEARAGRVVPEPSFARQAIEGAAAEGGSTTIAGPPQLLSTRCPSSMSPAELRKATQNAFVWLDYFSVPQTENQRKLEAVSSIHSYIADASYFLCLVPPARYEDGSPRDWHTWRRRGWCRMESLVNSLLPNPKPCLVVESMSSVFVSEHRDFPLYAAGLGDFTYPQDMDFLAHVILELIVIRQEAAMRDEDWFTVRMFECTKVSLLDGSKLRACLISEEPFLDWLSRMSFTCAEDCEDSGWTPLRHAIYMGRLDIARELLRLGADPNARLAAARMDWGEHAVSGTILHGISVIRDLPRAVAVLIQHRADAIAVDGAGRTPLHTAMIHGRCGAADAIMKRVPEAADLNSSLGMAPWLEAFCKGQTQAFFHYRKKYPFKVDCDPNHQLPSGFGVVHIALTLSGDQETVSVALDAGFDVNHVCQPSGSLVAIAQRASTQALCLTWRDPGGVSEMVANSQGGTPLMLAAFLGNVHGVELLVSRRADVQATNCYRRTALTLAAMRGHVAIAELLLWAMAPLDVSDTWGRSAMQWAEQRGHSRVVRAIRDRAPRGGGSKATPWLLRYQCSDATEPPAESGQHVIRFEQQARLFEEDAARALIGPMPMGFAVPSEDTAGLRAVRQWQRAGGLKRMERRAMTEDLDQRPALDDLWSSGSCAANCVATEELGPLGTEQAFESVGHAVGLGMAAALSEDSPSALGFSRSGARIIRI